MICSLKFFEPTVIWIPALSGFFSIRFAACSPPSPISPPSPQAAIASARASAKCTASSTRRRLRIIPTSVGAHRGHCESSSGVGGSVRRPQSRLAHHLDEALGLLEQRPVAGGFKDDEALARRRQLGEPLVGEVGPGAGLASALDPGRRDRQLARRLAQVDVLDL